MAYNTNTRLLLTFEDGGDLGFDSSSGARHATCFGDHTQDFYDPYGGAALSVMNTIGNTGYCAVDTPGALFAADTSTARTISFDLYVDSNGIPSVTNSYPLRIGFDNYDQFVCYVDDSGNFGVMIYTDAGVTNLSLSGSYINPLDTWHHVIISFIGNTAYLGIDGAFQSSVTHTGNIWSDGACNAFTVGMNFQDYGFWGLIGYVEALEGGTGYSGGSYTVPIAQPDPAPTTSPVTLALTGQGLVCVQGTVGISVTDTGVSLALNGQSLTPSTGIVGRALNYNPNTRLQIKFNETSGSTASVDTSVFGRSVAITGGETSNTTGVFGSNSLRVGNPTGTAAYTEGLVSSPGNLFTDSTTSVKQFDAWFRKTIPQTTTNNPIFSIATQSGDWLSLEWGSDGVTAIYNSVANGQRYLNPSIYLAYNTWHHARITIAGNTIKLAVNGAELATATQASDIWTANSLHNPTVEMRVGAYPSILGLDGSSYARGYIDCIEFLEGGSYTGGAYTVPASEPDSAPPQTPVTATLAGAAYNFSAGSVSASVYLHSDFPLSGQSYVVSTGVISAATDWTGEISFAGKLINFRTGQIISRIGREVAGAQVSYSSGTPGCQITQAGWVYPALSGATVSHMQGGLSVAQTSDKQAALVGSPFGLIQGGIMVAPQPPVMAVAVSGKSLALTAGQIVLSRGVSALGAPYAFAQSSPTPSILIPVTISITGQSNFFSFGMLSAQNYPPPIYVDFSAMPISGKTGQNNLWTLTR